MKIFYLARINVATEDASTRHVFEFCREMARAGQNITLFVPDLGTRRSLEGVEIVYVPVGLARSWFTYAAFYLSLAVILPGRWLKGRPEVLYTRHQPMEWCATWWKLLLRIKYVVEVNGLTPVELKINRRPDWWIACIRLLEWISFKLADRIVVPSSLIRDSLVRHYGLCPRNVLVVTNGANPEISRPLDRAACRKQLGLPEDEPCLVFVGSLKQWHGIGELLRLMPRLTRKIPDLHLLVVGDGARRRDLQQWVDDSGMGPSVHLVGRVAFEEVPVYINAADICLAPYFEEGLKDTGISPLKIFEYMACARPIISNPLGGLETLFRDHEIGIAIPSMNPEDWIEPIETLLANPARMERLGRNGHDAVLRHFSWQAICRNIVNFLEEPTDSRGSS